MFTAGKNFDHKKVPGFILVPTKTYTAQALFEYVQTNIHESRMLAKDYVKQQKVMSQVNNALEKKR